MALASRILKGLIKRSTSKILGRLGGKLISGFADTSADAPAASYAPKRQVYENMNRPAPAPAPTTSDEADHGHDHGHSHGHDHDHGHDH